MTNLAEGFNLKGPPIPDGIYVAWTFDVEKGISKVHQLFFREDDVLEYLRKHGGRYRIAARFHDQLPITIKADAT